MGNGIGDGGEIGGGGMGRWLVMVVLGEEVGDGDVGRRDYEWWLW